MKFLVVGLGSMGRRRIRLLKKIAPQSVVIGVDSSEKRCKETGEEYSIITSNNLNDSLEEYKPECVIVSTSPLSHANIIRTCLEAKCNVFSEINLVSDGYDENIALAEKNEKVLFLSSTFLYREEIEYIREKVSLCNNSVNYSYHVGQYLPDWHPWEKINEFFVGDKRTNGCRELFAIELPWITKVFGKIKSFVVQKSKMSSLEIDYDDNYQLILEHENGNRGVLLVDVVSRKPTRQLEVYNEGLYVTWGGTPSSLREYDIASHGDKAIDLYDGVSREKDYATFIIENAYESELRNFLDVVSGNGHSRYSFCEDLEIIQIIDQIEK